jgi:hypothetical protein
MMQMFKTINSPDADIATIACFDKLTRKIYVFYDVSSLIIPCHNNINFYHNSLVDDYYNQLGLNSGRVHIF